MTKNFGVYHCTHLVQEDPVEIPLISIELDRETSRVTSSVWRTLLTTDGGETGDQGGLLADLAEHVDGSKMADIMGDHEFCDSD